MPHCAEGSWIMQAVLREKMYKCLQEREWLKKNLQNLVGWPSSCCDASASFISPPIAISLHGMYSFIYFFVLNIPGVTISLSFISHLIDLSLLASQAKQLWQNQHVEDVSVRIHFSLILPVIQSNPDGGFLLTFGSHCSEHSRTQLREQVVLLTRNNTADTW